MIIDYAWGRPNYGLLKSAGVTGVARYISHDSRKDIFLPELQELRKQNLAVGFVFESTAGRALRGYGAGAADAAFAKSRLEALGIPDTVPVYFAVDFDATNSQKPLIAKYLRGAVSVLGHERTGVYGGYYVVRYMAQNDVCHWFWQTYAWSGGLIWKARSLARKLTPGKAVIHPTAHLYQYSNGHHVAGVSCDYNRSLTNDWGQFPRPILKPPKIKGSHIYMRAHDGTERWETFNVQNIRYRAKQVERGKWDEVSLVRKPKAILKS